ncbi:MULTISPECIES: MmgE/PrpD family protein [unclassified Bradyrhizobium]|uniref:MmgE/PrpD family protein n=1 Tax=unclassified Bradyrhizobium TaxID=2631580 RepID=UPI002479DFDC|nr:MULTISPECIES: MmgE/PrpD family protein [unclassified Bradyrhizobium]WGR73001.1 MmgE/PrpD family protein [Bradyrhizobium sp. ISRA426]WGR77836.1 MmgE/PrpD family protein [Bradyrhizobium sp. ISRA430]WGR88241.1 MmgE/PrpD family protein [Bradyrhizobium sp. ISRA432]
MDVTSTDLTGALARFVSTLDLADVPSDVKADARRLLLDSVGCILAAARTRMAPIVHGLAEFLGDGNAASIAGRKQRASLAGAVYANGRLANCMDLDETFPVGHHFGAGAVVAALALAELRKATGSRFLQALIAGYELGGRVASACGAHIFSKAGSVSHFSVSTVLAAAGVGIQLEAQDEVWARQTLGIAGSNTPLPSMWPGKSMDLPDSKYQDAGWAVLAGLFAARSATLGATGLSAIFDGERSLIKMCGTDCFDRDALVGDLGSRWMLPDITYKPWPTCRWMHQPLTALVAAASKAKIDPQQIESILIGTNVLVSGPRFCNPKPRTWVSRQYSFPHAVAMVLLGIPVGPAWLDDATDDLQYVKELREKVRVEPWDVANDYRSRIVRGQLRNMPARITILMRDGTRLATETDFALGDPWKSDTAYGDEHVIEKFRVVSGLSKARADQVIHAILNIEAQPDVEPIVSVLRDPGEVFGR